MRIGGDRVTAALLDMPRKMNVRGLISVLPMVIKRQSEKSALDVYIADCLRILTENTAKIGGGGYIKLRYNELIHPKPEEKRTSVEVISSFKSKLSKIRGD